MIDCKRMRHLDNSTKRRRSKYVRFSESDTNKSFKSFSILVFISVKIQRMLQHRVHRESLLDRGTEQVVVVNRIYKLRSKYKYQPNVEDLWRGICRDVSFSFWEMCPSS